MARVRSAHPRRALGRLRSGIEAAANDLRSVRHYGVVATRTAANPPARTASARNSVDRAVAEAVNLAREAAVAEGGSSVGEHLGVEPVGQRVAMHYFASTLAGYRGWRWAVTVARASRAKSVTVDEVVLLPGEGALLAPEWLPWSERLQPGDLGVGDLLPTAPDDDRLAPAYVESDDPAVEEVATEVGLGRVRVMSRLGREDAAERWRNSDTGPRTAMASHAPGKCAGCGFYLQVAGWLRPAFGVCGNEFSPADGRVVTADFGCGAHSEALVEATVPTDTHEVYDDRAIDVEPQRVAEGSVEGAEDAELGHS